MNDLGMVAGGIVGAVFVALVVAVFAFVRGRIEARAAREDRDHDIIVSGKNGPPHAPDLSALVSSLTAEIQRLRESAETRSDKASASLMSVHVQLAGLDAHVRATLGGYDTRLAKLEGAGFVTAPEVARAVEYQHRKG